MPLFQSRSLNDHTDSIAHYMPGGQLTEARFIDGTYMRRFLRALASELFRYQYILEDTATEHDIEVTQNLINEWENALGIPKSCFSDRTYSLEDRRLHLLMVLNNLHGTTEDDFIQLAAILGYTVEVRPVTPNAIFPMRFPIFFFDTGKAAKFSMIVRLPADDELVGFPLAFPIRFIRPDNQLLRCLFNKMKPANVKIFFIFDIV